MVNVHAATFRLLAFVWVLTAFGQGQLAFGQPCLCETRDSVSLTPPDEPPRNVYIRQAVDTCGLGPVADCHWHELLRGYSSRPWLSQGRLYATGRFLIDFPEGAFVLGPAPDDSLVVVDWRRVDTGFRELREGLSAIETEFGTYALLKAFPEDTAGHLSRRFFCLFRDLVRLDLALSRFNALPGTLASYFDWPKWVMGVSPQQRHRNSFACNVTCRGRSVLISFETDRLPVRATFVDLLGRELYRTLLTAPASQVDLPSSTAKCLFVVIGRSILPIILQ